MKNQRTLEFNFPAKFCASLRQRPGMYFGFGGSRAIPVMIMQIINAVIGRAPRTHKGSIEVSIQSEEQSVIFHGLSDATFSPAGFAFWLAELGKRVALARAPRKMSKVEGERESARSQVMFTALASDKFTITETSGTNVSRLVSREGKLTVSSRTNSGKRGTSLRIEFRQNKALFGEAGHKEKYSVAGALRDLSILRAGLATRVTFGSDGDVRHFYERGLESALMQEDHQRWPIYEGILKASSKRGGLRFECCVRFLHSGQPRIKSWVNYLPTQGGSHVKAIGRALSELFPEYDRGCRTLPLMVDTDSSENIMLPRALIGMLHVETEDPRFKGPTKDVLIGEEVEAFVYEAARKQFRKQWVILKEHRAI